MYNVYVTYNDGDKFDGIALDKVTGFENVDRVIVGKNEVTIYTKKDYAKTYKFKKIVNVEVIEIHRDTDYD
jgi:hypothetical protein